jgi:hypothetical protein
LLKSQQEGGKEGWREGEKEVKKRRKGRKEMHSVHQLRRGLVVESSSCDGSGHSWMMMFLSTPHGGQTELSRN